MQDSPQPRRTGYREAETPCSGTPCRIVFFYEDFDAAIRCRKAFDSIANSLCCGRAVMASSWSFSMLGSSEFNAAILMETSGADVMVVSARGDRELPARVATWIEMCVNGCGDTRPVLLALHAEGMEPDGEAAPLCTSVECIASRQGTPVMCSRDLWLAHADAVPVRALPRSSGAGGGVLEPGTYPTAGVQRWWGIND